MDDGWQTVVWGGHGLPLDAHIARVAPHDTHLVAATLAGQFLATAREWLIAARAYESDARLRDEPG